MTEEIIYVVEFSKSQNCFHIGQKWDLFQGDMRAYEERNWVGDYETLKEFKTRDEAREWLRKYKEEIGWQK